MEMTEQQRCLKFHKYKDCENDDDLGYTDTIKHKIKTIDDKAIKIPHRRIPPNQMEESGNILRNYLSKK